MSRTIEISDETFEKLKDRLTADEQVDIDTLKRKKRAIRYVKIPISAPNFAIACNRCSTKKRERYCIAPLIMGNSLCNCGKCHPQYEVRPKFFTHISLTPPRKKTH